MSGDTLLGALLALAISLPVAVVWCWLICRDHERLQPMHPKPRPKL